MTTNATLRTLLKALPEREVRTILQRWDAATAGVEPQQNGSRSNGEHASPAHGGEGKAARGGLVRRLGALMSDEELVQRRVKELPEKLADLLEGFLRTDGHQRDVRGVLEAHAGAFRSRFEVEASLVALQREGFLFPSNGDPREGPWAVPDELAGCILEVRRRQQVELRGTLSLKGFLTERYYARAKDDPDGAQRGVEHARRVYKIYLMESSIKNRIRGLSEEVRFVFDRALAAFGGVMPLAELQRTIEDEELEVDVDLVRKCLEDAMLGTVAPLRLTRFGIAGVESAVVIFYEVALHCLQSWADEHGEPDIEEALSSGVDLVSNVGRFLREVASTRVQFTVEGKLYKASAKRITKGFLPVPGGYLPPETQARFIYQFCLSRRLIERSGERGLRLSSAGHDFDGLSLQDKLRSLLAFAVEERCTQGEHFHQVRLRRILLRLLRRLEPDLWHEALFVPFLARNGYLGRLDDLNVEDAFAARFKGGGYQPTETTHQICLHLLDFVKRRLYPLGLVDLGLREGRPVAIRLSRLGAELLGAEAAGEVGGSRSSVVVNPDFEIILFPGDDEHEAVHVFDRFCERVKTDHIHHFRLTKDAVHGALAEGMPLFQIVQELADRSRAPLPQNVVYSLEDWGDQAGVLTLDESGVLTGRKAELIDRFCAQPGLEKAVQRRCSPTSVELRRTTDIDRLLDVARDLGFLIEQREPEPRPDTGAAS